ncbi:hypothetical protein HCH52_03900 [Oscillospiraceae bacterium HV4-5-C5C]|nr:hypothetical protein [Oscillospiraceae bacterium HV4-5-C5C]
MAQLLTVSRAIPVAGIVIATSSLGLVSMIVSTAVILAGKIPVPGLMETGQISIARLTERPA